MALKTNKSYSKRIKVGKRGKMTARTPGQNHFNAKESRGSQLAKKRTQSFTMTAKRTARYLPYK
ncbi:MAG: hypothetical protein AAB840_02760 [Patescibacteria group bacterium]